MKTLFAVIVSISSLALSTHAQVGQPGATALSSTPLAGNQLGPAQLVLTERQPHARSWSWITWETGPAGEQIARTNSSFVEIGTGLCFRDTDGELKDSAEVIVPVPGGAQASQGQTIVFWPNDLTNGAIQIQMPDGKKIATSPRFLAYADDTGKSVLIGEIKECQGQIVAPNCVLYEDVCPDDIKGVTLRFTYHLWGLEAEVLFTEELPAGPEAFQMSAEPGKCALQMWTEWFTEEQPGVTATGAQAALPGGTDVEVDFGGAMRIGAGQAFSLVPDRKGPGLPVQKAFVTVEGCQYLIEQVSAADFFKLAALPPKEGASLRPAAERERFLATTVKGLPGRRPAVAGGRAMEVVAARLAAKGAYIDYTLINSTYTNYHFRSDITYFVSSVASMYGTTTVEGGTVLKFTNSPSVKLSLNGPLVCNTAGYKPATFTCRTDNTIGQMVAGGTPTNYNGATFIDAAAGQSNAYKWLRFCYAGKGIRGLILTNGIWHSQFVRCGTAVESTGSNPVPLRNVLISQCTNAVVTTNSFSGEHLTVDQCSTLLSGTGSSGTLTNSLLTAIGTLGNVSLDSSPRFSSGTGLYQTVAAGNYYLGCWTNIGNTNINPALRQDLGRLTTDPPLLLPSTINSALTLSPEAQRGTGAPVPGYYYAPLDYLASNVVLTASLTLNNGVAVGVCGSYGFFLQLGPLSYNGQQGAGPMGTLGMTGDGVVLSEGTPLSMNALTQTRNVQEQALSLGGSIVFQPTNTSPQLGLRFTEVSLAQGGLGTFLAAYPPTQCFSNLFVRDCPWRGVYLLASSISSLDPGNLSLVALTNNLLERCSLYFQNALSGANPYSNNLQVILRNNLFWQGALSLNYYVGPVNPTWQVQDDLFDLCGTTFWTDYGSGYVTRSYNGFTTNTVNALGGSSNKTNLVADYQTGPLGPYYYPTNGGSYSLTNLIDAASTWATNVGLYHFTTTTNQVKEAGTKVDIGFHLVALGTNGLPASASGDMLGDYFKDSNGNGVYDSADMGNWKTNDTCGDGISDYIKYLQGRNLRVKATNDPNNLIQLNVYTPLK